MLNELRIKKVNKVDGVYSTITSKINGVTLETSCNLNTNRYYVSYNGVIVSCYETTSKYYPFNLKSNHNIYMSYLEDASKPLEDGLTLGQSQFITRQLLEDLKTETIKTTYRPIISYKNASSSWNEDIKLVTADMVHYGNMFRLYINMPTTDKPMSY